MSKKWKNFDMSNLPIFTRIAELEALLASEMKSNERLSARELELEQRIEKAKALVGHKSLDSRRELLAILEGE